MKKTLLLFAVYVCLAVVSAAAQSVRPSVSVVGQADMSVAPDQVVFTFEVVTTDKDISQAKQDNDASSARTLAVAKTFNISNDDIQTDSLTISPRYTTDKDPRGSHVLLGYEVDKRILVTLKDLSKIDRFLASVIEAGVNRIVNIAIENSQYQKYQEQVRALAVKNARDRAAAYAKQLGQTVGAAYVIREEEADNPAYNSGVGSGGGVGDGNGDSEIGDLSKPKAYDRIVSFALGKIKVEEKIFVIFDLVK
jgi:uncharacterized protein YggE